MLCYRCGNNVPDLALKCSNCGAELGSATRAMRIPKGSIKALKEKRSQGASSKGVAYKDGDLIAGRYKVKSTLGKGPFATVLNTFDRELEAEVAVKVWPVKLFPKASDRERFESSIRQARRLSQQNIVRLHDSGFDEGQAFVAMQRLEGLNFRKVMALRKPGERAFGLDETQPLLAQLVQALEHCHRSSFHGDLKPENIIVEPERLKITDFHVYHALSYPRFMRPNKNSVYLAPEVAADENGADARSDIYSLAVILGEMLGGVALSDKFEFPSVNNPSLPPALDEVFAKATHADPAERYQRAAELQRAFAEVVNRAPVLVDAALEPDVVDSGVIDAIAPDPHSLHEVDSEEVLDEIEPESVEDAEIELIDDADLEELDPLNEPTDCDIAAPVPPVPQDSADQDSADQISEEVMILDAEADIEIVELDAGAAGEGLAEDEIETTEVPRDGKLPGGKVDETLAAVAGVLAAAPPKTKKKKGKRRRRHGEPPKRRTKPKAAAAPPAVKATRNLATDRVKALPKVKTQGQPVAPSRSTRNSALALVAAILLIVVAGFVALVLLNKGDHAAETTVANFGKGAKSNTLVKSEHPADAIANDDLPDSGQAAQSDAGLRAASEQDDAGTKDDGTGATNAALEAAAAKEEEAKAAAAKEEEAKAAAAKEEEAKAAAAKEEEAKAAAAKEAQAKAAAAKEEEAKRLAAEKKASDQKAAAAKKLEAQRLAAERKIAAEKRAADKKAAAEKRAEARRAAAEKRAADRKAAAEKRAEAKRRAAEKKRIAAAERKAAAAKANPGKLTCPAGMSLIKHRKNKWEPYCIDRYEYPGGGARPQTNVSWYGADTACKSRGKRLCAIKEWQRGCGGKYPWGRSWDPNRCNTEDADELERSVRATGAQKSCRNGWGVYDMVGNVSEWVQEQRVVGGDATSGEKQAMCYYASNKSAGSSSGLVGFRCCADPQ